MAYTPVLGTKKTGGYVPIAKKSSTPTATATKSSFPLVFKSEADYLANQNPDLFKPSASGISQSTSPTSKIGTLDVVKDIGYGADLLSGAITQIPAQVSNLLEGGKLQPVQSLTESNIEGIKNLGASEKTATIAGIGLSIAGDPLNLITGGGAGATKLARLLAKTDDLVRISKLYRDAGFAEDLVKLRAPILAAEKDANKIVKIIESDAKLQATTKQSTYTPILNQTPELSPLAKEAQKADTSGPFGGQKLEKTAKPSELSTPFTSDGNQPPLGKADGSVSNNLVEIARPFTDPKTNFEILPNTYLKPPKKLYRGEQAMTGFGTGSGVEGFGLYTTTDKAVAAGYAKATPGGVLKEMSLSDIPKNPLYFRGPAEMRSWKDRIAKQMGVRPAEFDAKYGGFNELLTSMGYDGAAFDLGNGVAYVKYPKSSTSIPKELSSLATEAQKYSSAEEFVYGVKTSEVKNSLRGDILTKDVPIYRGTGGAHRANETFVRGDYYTPSPSKALEYTFGNRVRDVQVSVLKKGAKVFDLDQLKNPKQTLVPTDVMLQPDKLSQFLKDKGYQATRNTNNGFEEIVRLDTRANSRAFSQVKNPIANLDLTGNDAVGRPQDFSKAPDWMKESRKQYLEEQQYIADQLSREQTSSQLTDFYNKVKGEVKATGQKTLGTPRIEQTAPPQKPLQAQTPQPQSVPPKASPRVESLQEVEKPASGRSIPQSTYEGNRLALKEKTGRVARVINGLKAAWGSVGEGTDKILGTISTRLKNIDPSLKIAIRNFEFKLGTSIQADRKSVAGFLKGVKAKSIDVEDYADLDLALKNGDLSKTEEIISKYGLEKEFAQVRTTLDDLYARAKDVGYDIGYEKNYFPRMIEDADGFLEHLGMGDDWSMINAAIVAKETEIGRYLTVKEKANLVNTLVRGYGGKITLSKTGAMKSRQIDFIDANLNQFYRDSVESLIRYIDDTNDAIEARRFFGKGNKTDQFANVDDSIGSYIFDLVAKGKVKPSQEKELRDILQARFASVGTSGVVRVYKNLSYIDTMGSFTSAITQLGDFAFAIYKGGPIQTIKAATKAVFGRSQITRADLGIEKIAQEFEDSSRSARAVDRVFRLIGLHKMDALGKETVINAVIARYRKLADEPTTDFMRRLEAVFGNDTTKIIDDLKSGRVTEDVKLLAFNELLDVQPIALSEMPEQYLKGGNGRIFYMLKTYTIKLFDVYRNEVFQEIAAGNKVQGIKNLMYLTGALVAMNATADEIKDLMLNRETSLSDRVVDNILKLAGFSKFTIYKAREEGIGSAVAKTILPPFKFIDSAYKDLTQGDFDETPQSIPIGGKLYYWWFGKGAEKSEKKRNPSNGGTASAEVLKKYGIDVPSKADILKKYNIQTPSSAILDKYK